MKALVLDEIGLFEAKAFSEVDPYTDPLVLTKRQKDILDDLFQRLLSNKKLTPEELELVKKHYKNITMLSKKVSVLRNKRAFSIWRNNGTT
jgi:hypothetical protein